jgi:hypothetical protein
VARRAVGEEQLLAKGDLVLPEGLARAGLGGGDGRVGQAGDQQRTHQDDDERERVAAVPHDGVHDVIGPLS